MTLSDKILLEKMGRYRRWERKVQITSDEKERKKKGGIKIFKPKI